MLIKSREATFPLFILIFGLVSCGSKVGNSFTGKIQQYIDGDTIVVIDNDGVNRKIHIYGIDAPELDQPYGLESKKELERVLGYDTLLNDRLCFEVMYLNSKGEEVCSISREIVYSDGQVGGLDRWLEKRLLQAGAAWYDPESQADLKEDEDWASVNKTGLWNNSNPIPPWKWRDLSDDVKAKYRVSNNAEQQKKSAESTKAKNEPVKTGD